MKAIPALLSGLVLVASCIAQESSTSDLRQRAEQSKGADCARLSMQAARQILEDANHLFGSGNAKAAHSAIDDSLGYASRSVTCTLESRKHEKSTEIDLRKLIRRMKDVQQTLDADDQPHLAHALIALEEQRDRLLHSIFGSAAGGTGEKRP